jgi:hypothetical protein
MRKTLTILAAILMTSAMCGASSDPLRKHEPPEVTGPAASISGIVRNNRDEVVNNAVVRFMKRGAGKASFQRSTTTDGTFSVQLTPGVYHVTAQRRGQGRSSTLVNFSPNQVMNLEISLQKGPRFVCCGGHHPFRLGTRGVHKQ